MKLVTSIPPRRDGVVNVEDKGRTFVFTPDAQGDLVCEVGDDRLVAWLLASENFAPADEADFDAAEALLDNAAEAAALLAAGNDHGDLEDGPDDDPIDPDALPVEANTPPKPAAPAVKHAANKPPKPAAKKPAAAKRARA